MKLSETTLNILKNFSAINQSIKITGGTTISTIAPTKTVLAKAEVPDLFDRPFCIYDLNRFLSILSMFEDPEITLDTTSLIISDAKTGNGLQKVTYRYCDEKVIVAAPANDVNFPKPDVSFTLTQKDIAKVNKAAGVLQLPEIAIVGEEGNLYLRSVNSKDAGSDAFNVLVGESDTDFVATFKPEYFSKLIAGDYEVEVSSKKISRFTGKNVVYYIAVEANSTFA
jgi:hypothetical protein